MCSYCVCVAAHPCWPVCFYINWFNCVFFFYYLCFCLCKQTHLCPYLPSHGARSEFLPQCSGTWCPWWPPLSPPVGEAGSARRPRPGWRRSSDSAGGDWRHCGGKWERDRRRASPMSLWKGDKQGRVSLETFQINWMWFSPLSVGRDPAVAPIQATNSRVAARPVTHPPFISQKRPVWGGGSSSLFTLRHVHDTHQRHVCWSMFSSGTQMFICLFDNLFLSQPHAPFSSHNHIFKCVTCEQKWIVFKWILDVLPNCCK